MVLEDLTDEELLHEIVRRLDRASRIKAMSAGSRKVCRAAAVRRSSKPSSGRSTAVAWILERRCQGANGTLNLSGHSRRTMTAPASSLAVPCSAAAPLSARSSITGGQSARNSGLLRRRRTCR